MKIFRIPSPIFFANIEFFRSKLVEAVSLQWSEFITNKHITSPNRQTGNGNITNLISEVMPSLTPSHRLDSTR